MQRFTVREEDIAGTEVEGWIDHFVRFGPGEIVIAKLSSLSRSLTRRGGKTRCGLTDGVPVSRLAPMRPTRVGSSPASRKWFCHRISDR